jgi:hypothetical protein
VTGQVDHASNPKARRKARDGERKMHAEREQQVTAETTSAMTAEPKEGFTLSDCRLYWGSHGCCYHDEDGSHWCDCCECEKHPDPDPGNHEDAPSCVAGPPYYGDSTRFYGEDAKENM